MNEWPAIPQDPRDPGSPLFQPGVRVWLPGEALTEFEERKTAWRRS